MASFTFPWDVNSTCKHEWQSHRWVHDQGLKPFSPVGIIYLIRSMATSLPISSLDESFSNRITPQIKAGQVSERGHWTGSIRRTITCTHFSLRAPLADPAAPLSSQHPTEHFLSDSQELSLLQHEMWHLVVLSRPRIPRSLSPNGNSFSANCCMQINIWIYYNFSQNPDRNL